MKILIAEDDLILAEELKESLRLSGHTVRVIHNGHSLLNIIRTGYVPDAIILDLNLPYRSGIELLPSIISRWEKTKIYIYSGYVNNSYKLSKSVQGCFSKGEGFTKLLQAING